MPEIITRAESGVKGLKRYFTGKPCKRGHIEERLVSNGTCFGCVAEHRQAPEGRAYAVAYRANNRAVLLAKQVAYTATPEGKARAMNRKYNIPLGVGAYIAEHMAMGDCPGCGVKFGHPKSMTRACVDHDHDTGLVRMIVCLPCNLQRLRQSKDGRNPDALLLAAGLNAKHGGRAGRKRALIQVRLAALLIEHYKGHSPAIAKRLMIPMPTP